MMASHTLVRLGYADTSLGQIHFRIAGQGEPYLLLAAAGHSSRMFAELMPLLAPSFQVVAVDTPGFGRSAPLAPGTTIEQIAASFIEVLDQLGFQTCRVYGLHTGNKIATAMAVAAPKRFTAITLAGQSHSLIPDREARNGAILRIVQSVLDEAAPATDAAAVWASQYRRIADLWWAPAVASAGWIGTARDRAVQGALDELEAEGTAALYQANLSYDLGADMRRIAVPTLVLEITTPEEDRTLGRQAENVRRLIPHATLAEIHEQRGFTLTLENRASDLAAILLRHA